MKKKAALLCLALAGALLLLAACTKTEDKEPEDTGEPSPSPTGQISPDPQDSETPSLSPIPEDDEPRLTAVIYVPDGEAVGFDTVEVPVEGTAQGLLDALIQEGVVDQNVELLSFEMTEEGGEVTGALDLSQAFLTQLESGLLPRGGEHRRLRGPAAGARRGRHLGQADSLRPAVGAPHLPGADLRAERGPHNQIAPAPRPGLPGLGVFLCPEKKF